MKHKQKNVEQQWTTKSRSKFAELAREVLANQKLKELAK